MTLWIQIVCRICWGRFRDPAGHSQQPSLAPLKDPWKSVKELNTVAHAACRWRCSSSCMASRLCCSNLATALCGTKCWVQLVIALLLWVSAATWPGCNFFNITDSPLFCGHAAQLKLLDRHWDRRAKHPAGYGGTVWAFMGMFKPCLCYVAASDLRLRKKKEHRAVLSSLKTGQILTLPLLFLRSAIFSILTAPQDLAKLDLQIHMIIWIHTEHSFKQRSFCILFSSSFRNAFLTALAATVATEKLELKKTF